MGYSEDREALANAIKQSDGNWLSWNTPYPARGQRGEPLSMDVFYYGPERNGIPAAENVIMTISGTHGLEGPAGSRAQTSFVKESIFRKLPGNPGVALVHALNPWGYEYGRRVDHNNVDVNRACGGIFETRSAYANFVSVLEPAVWDEEAKRQLDEVGRGRFAELKDAATGGQYDYPKGLFYGGTELCWSARVLRGFCERWFSQAERLALIDIHTGLGEYAQGVYLSPATSAENALARRTKKWLGLSVEFPFVVGAGSVSSPVQGDLLTAVSGWLPDTEITPVAIEMGGAIPPPVSLPRLVVENWAYHNPSLLRVGESLEIKRDLWEVFYPKEDFWHGAMWNRVRNTAEAMAEGLRI